MTAARGGDPMLALQKRYGKLGPAEFEAQNPMKFVADEEEFNK
jgi:hypothetical protein